MMSRARCWTGVVLSAGLAASASGQAPGVPAGAPAGAPAAATAAAPAAAEAGKTHALKAFFAGCKERFCASPLGNLVQNSMQPLSALSGGILGGCCPTGPTA